MSAGFNIRPLTPRPVDMPQFTGPGNAVDMPTVSPFNPGWRAAPPTYADPNRTMQHAVLRAERDPDASRWQRFNYPDPFRGTGAPRVQAPISDGRLQPVFPRAVPGQFNFGQERRFGQGGMSLQDFFDSIRR